MGVPGIGGLFFRAREPDRLNGWYREHLGIGAGCVAEDAGDPEEWNWKTQGGRVVFGPFKAASDYFPADKQYMLNLRVSGLNEMVAKLRASSIEVEIRDDWTDTDAGGFARIHGHEGNRIELWPIELWEPPAR